MQYLTTMFLILITLSTVSSAEGIKERFDIDPALQGVWMVHVSSTDEGKTLNRIKPPMAAVRVRATTYRTTEDKDYLKFGKICIHTDKNGNVSNLAKLANGKVMWISNTKMNGTFLVQLFDVDSDPWKETARWVITVEK